MVMVIVYFFFWTCRGSGKAFYKWLKLKYTFVWCRYSAKCWSGWYWPVLPWRIELNDFNINLKNLYPFEFFSDEVVKLFMALLNEWDDESMHKRFTGRKRKQVSKIKVWKERDTMRLVQNLIHESYCTSSKKNKESWSERMWKIGNFNPGSYSF